MLRLSRLSGCILSLAIAACGTTGGSGGGGVFVAKDASGDGSATADTQAGNDTVSGADSGQLQDTLGTDGSAIDDIQPGEDLLVVDIVDKPDMTQTDSGPKDTGPKDAGPKDTGSTGACVATMACDPVGNTCTASGEACDIASDGSAQCFPPPNDVAPGGACDNGNGPFCQGGYHCGDQGTCQKFCCSDADCPNGKACTPLGLIQTDSIGVCAP